MQNGGAYVRVMRRSIPFAFEYSRTLERARRSALERFSAGSETAVPTAVLGDSPPSWAPRKKIEASCAVGNHFTTHPELHGIEVQPSTSFVPLSSRGRPPAAGANPLPLGAAKLLVGVETDGRNADTTDQPFGSEDLAVGLRSRLAGTSPPFANARERASSQ